MSCEKCDELNETVRSYVRVGTGNVGIAGCDEHLGELCRRLRLYPASDNSIPLSAIHKPLVTIEDWDLQCQACRRIENIKADFTRLYSAMNELGWALIPSCHGHLVRGICPKCQEQEKADV